MGASVERVSVLNTCVYGISPQMHTASENIEREGLESSVRHRKGRDRETRGMTVISADFDSKCFTHSIKRPLV